MADKMTEHGILKKSGELLPEEESELDPAAREFYREVMILAGEAGIPFLVGGAFAFRTLTGIVRHTKDFDIFVHPSDFERMLGLLSDSGYTTEITDSSWLGKSFHNDYYIDLIFGSANGLSVVDDQWFTYAIEDQVLGLTVKLCPAEETIWSKSFVMERERFDGADIAHLILACGDSLDWDRLLHRFGRFWHILFVHLTLFQFIYPSERNKIPESVMDELLNRLKKEYSSTPPAERICRGTLLAITQYDIDITRGFTDARKLIKSGS